MIAGYRNGGNEHGQDPLKFVASKVVQWKEKGWRAYEAREWT